MTSRFLFILLLLCWIFPAEAESIPLPKIRYTEEESTPSIRPTGKIAERPDPENLAMKDSRKNSLASAIAQSGIRYDWAPSIDRGQASSPAAIRDAVLSSDASVLAVLERVGEYPGPYGSRVVFLNTANGTVLRYVDLGAVDCTRLHFFETSLLLLKKGAEDQPDELLSFSIVPFAAQPEKKFHFPQRVSGFATGAAGTLFVKSGVSLYQFSHNGSKTGLWKLRSPGGKLVCDSATNRIFSLFPGRIERCRPDHERIILEENIAVDGNPEYAIPVQNWLLAGESGQFPQLLFCDEKTPPLCLESSCSGAGFFDPSGMLYLVLDRNRDIGVFRLPSSSRPVSLIKVNSLRPKTNGEIRFLFRLPGKNMNILALDDRANLMRLFSRKHNVYQKTILFVPAENL